MTLFKGELKGQCAIQVLQSSNQKDSADIMVSSKVLFTNMQNNKIKDAYYLQGEYLQKLDCAMKKKTDLEKMLEKMLGISEVLQGRKAELFPNNIKRTAKCHLTNDKLCFLKNICYSLSLEVF